MLHLSDIWFIAIAVLWAGYFVLEGFDFGVGILLPFLGRDQRERRAMINTIGPVWDGNEVWLLIAGGATFAAFPDWYATLFSAFYLPLLLILVALIIRGVAFEYRGKRDSARWRHGWDTRDLRRLAAAGAAVGRRLRQHPARHPAERRAQLHRQLLHPAQPVRAARRRDHADAVHAERGAVPRPEDHRRPAPPGRRAGLEVGLVAIVAGGGLPRLDRGQLPQPRSRGHRGRLGGARGGGGGHADRRRAGQPARRARAGRSPRWPRPSSPRRPRCSPRCSRTCCRPRPAPPTP